MKKWFKWLIVPVLVTGFVGYAMSADNSRLITQMTGEGRTADYLVNNVYDSSTVAGYKMKRKVNTVPIALVTAGEDSLETCVFAVPTGQSAIITGLFLTSYTEVSGNNDSVWAVVLWYNATALDTMVARFAIDADSANYDNNLLELTRIDSVLAAGDMVFWRTEAFEGAAVGAVGASLVVEYLLSE